MSSSQDSIRVTMASISDQDPSGSSEPCRSGPKCTPAELLLKVVLTGTLSHFETRGMIDEKRLEHMLLAGKQILYKSHQESDVRYVLFFLQFFLSAKASSSKNLLLT
jgi:hypothetical protein